MSDGRIIKKYPNRRLYDTHISRYITLEEIRQLVLQDVKFRVEDKRTHDDITRSILLQVISDQEEGGDPIFTNDLLEFIIRRSEEHTSELQSLMRISYAVFCLKKKKTKQTQQPQIT